MSFAFPRPTVGIFIAAPKLVRDDGEAEALKEHVELLFRMVLSEVDALSAIDDEVWVVTWDELDGDLRIQVDSILAFDEGLDFRIITELSRGARFNDSRDALHRHEHHCHVRKHREEGIVRVL